MNISFYDGVKYTRTAFLNRDKDFFGNGVVQSTHFPTTLTGNDMKINIGAGVAWVDGYRIENDTATIQLTVTASNPTLPRIDIIQIGHDDVNSLPSLVIKQGVASASPVEPGADIGYVKLYAISVGANVTKIISGNITDRRNLVPLNVSGTQISFAGAMSSTPTQVTSGDWNSLKIQGTYAVTVANLTSAPNTTDTFHLLVITDGANGITQLAYGRSNPNLLFERSSLDGGTTWSSSWTSFSKNLPNGVAPLDVNIKVPLSNLYTGSGKGFDADMLDGLHADGVVGQRIQLNAPAQDQYWLVGTLPASQSTTFDKLIIEFQGGPDWDSTVLINDWIMFGNRDTGSGNSSKFNYQYMQEGNDPINSRQNLRVIAYKQVDGSINVYLRGLASKSAIAIVAAYGASLSSQQNTAVAIGNATTTVPTGTIVFDSGNNATYPPNATSAQGGATFNGNVAVTGTMTVGGSSVVTQATIGNSTVGATLYVYNNAWGGF
jgi:hypothetical protein